MTGVLNALWRHLLPQGEKGDDPPRPCYAELATTTNFSFLRGASHPEELVARAAELGLAGLGVADRNTLAGVVRAHVFARENSAGARRHCASSRARGSLRRRRARLLAYPRDRAAYGRLCRLLTTGNLRAPKGECHLHLDDLLDHGEGLQIVAMPLIRPFGHSASARRRQALSR